MKHKYKTGDKVKSLSIGYGRRIGTRGVIQNLTYDWETEVLTNVRNKILYYVVMFDNNYKVTVWEDDLALISPLEEVL